MFSVLQHKNLVNQYEADQGRPAAKVAKTTCKRLFVDLGLNNRLVKQ